MALSLSEGQEARKRLAETFTLLWAMEKIPERPKQCQKHAAEDGSRRLNVARERQLSDDLAFISTTTADSLKVMAAAVEEEPHGCGITIRLASNKGPISDIKGQFEVLARTLERAASRSTYRAAD